MVPTLRNLKECPARKGFSLIEVVLALGIASFALIGILSIFPVALGTAQDAVIETKVALIAQNIFSDLRDGAPDEATVVVGPNAIEDVEQHPLDGFPDTYLAFDLAGVPLDGNGKITASQFKEGFPDSDAYFLAAIRVGPASTDPALANLVQVTVEVLAPASRGADRRGKKSYEFVTWMPKSS